MKNLLDINNIIKNPIEDIIGQEPAKYQIKSALIASRHILIIGSPGIGKTTIAKNISKLLTKKKDKESFIRVQGSPDLTVEDIIGDIDPIKAMKYGPMSIEAFSPGKIFKADQGILFFDEINRAPEKLQNTLLQALQEKKVTIGSYDVDIDVNFILIATMNPEDINTQKLSYVLLDRFDVIYMDYPKNTKEEYDIVVKSAQDLINVNKLTKKDQDMNKKLLHYFIEFVREIRENDLLLHKPSPRASIGLYERAQSNALLSKRKAPDFQDYRDALNSVLKHRIELKPSAKIKTNPDEFLDKEFNKYTEKHPDSNIVKDHST